MLTSITPLGERSRGRRWGITAATYLIGSIAGGALLGALLGAIGGALAGELSASGRALLLAAVLLAGLLLDLRGDRWLRGLHRQVNEDWLHTYRGWVYGLGFGFQLGMGVVTIVASSAVYLAFLAALLSASVPAGAAIGAAFGLLRGAAILATLGVHDPAALARLGQRLRSWERPARSLGLLSQSVLAAAVLAAAVT